VKAHRIEGKFGAKPQCASDGASPSANPIEIGVRGAEKTDRPWRVVAGTLSDIGAAYILSSRKLVTAVSSLHPVSVPKKLHASRSLTTAARQYPKLMIAFVGKATSWLAHSHSAAFFDRSCQTGPVALEYWNQSSQTPIDDAR
jgi:hypothetical protein